MNNILNLSPFERFEFAFIFIPSNAHLALLNKLATLIDYEIENLKQLHTPTINEYYHNHVVNFPHLSVGQYGLMGIEIDPLIHIVEQVSNNIPAFQLEMLPELSFLDNYVFFDAQDCYKNVDPIFKNTFLRFRDQFFKNIQTKFPIKQAYLHKQKNSDSILELDLIDQFYQNWMIPEHNRMRPHFTLQYFPVFNKNLIELKLGHNPKIQNLLKKLQNIFIDKIGFIEIDTFGNPTTKNPHYWINLH
ncbi:MAG: hypothetical protein C0432_02445 [Candidatus Puniceispirillum sp.]|nr:hypothetical protein [Candidatus Pelagibacter sp.]MBA4283135.1 hypothetical protein [Candidatus Puniceispirillum sp.]